MPSETVTTLWVDDDCNGLLLPLGRLLQRKGKLILTTAASYSSAINKLTDVQNVAGNKIRTLLLDIVLPYSEGAGALASDLGITLAQRAIKYGVKRIAFLSVMRLDEIVDKYSELVSNHPDVNFAYFDKTTLLGPSELEALIAFLSGDDYGERKLSASTNSETRHNPET